MHVIERLEYELRTLARHGKTLRHRRALRQHAGKVRRGPDRREIDAAVMKAVGVDEARNRTERQVVAIDRMSREQGPAVVAFDGPEAIELDRGCVAPRERRT